MAISPSWFWLILLSVCVPDSLFLLFINVERQMQVDGVITAPGPRFLPTQAPGSVQIQ